MLKTLRSKYEALKNDEFARNRLSENLQVAFVAAFWTGFIVFLMYYGKTHPLPEAKAKNPTPHSMSAKFY